MRLRVGGAALLEDDEVAFREPGRGLRPRTMRSELAPGPPFMRSTGSGAGFAPLLFRRMTGSRIVRPPGRARFSGTTRVPQRALSFSESGSSIAQVPGSKRGTGRASADANGATRSTTTAASIAAVLRPGPRKDAPRYGKRTQIESLRAEAW
jgi:hypothetical protein